MFRLVALLALFASSSAFVVPTTGAVVQRSTVSAQSIVMAPKAVAGKKVAPKKVVAKKVVAKKVVKKAAPKKVVKKVVKKAPPKKVVAKKVVKKVVPKKAAAKAGESKSISGIFDSLILGNTLSSAKIGEGKGKTKNWLGSNNWLFQAAGTLAKLPEGRTTRMTRGKASDL